MNQHLINGISGFKIFLTHKSMQIWLLDGISFQFYDFYAKHAIFYDHSLKSSTHIKNLWFIFLMKNF